MHIFVTGVAGRAMGSGKFAAEDIRQLTLEAHAAFLEVFGDPFAQEERLAIQQEPRANPVEPRPNLQRVKPMETQTTTSNEPGPAQGRPFREWAHEKIKLGKNRPGPGGKPWSEVTWAEAHKHAAGGGKGTLGFLEFLAGIQDKDPKFSASNEATRTRAAAVIAASSLDRGDPAGDSEPF